MEARLSSAPPLSHIAIPRAVIFPLAAVALVVAAAFLIGCSMFASTSTATRPARTQIDRIDYGADGKPSRKIEMTHTGAGQSARGDKASGQIDATSPSVVVMADGSIEVGESLFGWSYKIKGSAGMWSLIGLGGLLVVGGAVMGYLTKSINPLLWLGVPGVGLIVLGVVASAYPWVFLIAGVVLLGVVGWFAWQAFKRFRVESALRDVAAGVESAPADAQEAVKESISKVVGGDVSTKAEITRIKASLPARGGA